MLSYNNKLDITDIRKPLSPQIKENSLSLSRIWFKKMPAKQHSALDNHIRKVRQVGTPCLTIYL